ncbi:hypothetical protein [Planctomicrobium piriforme]|uniref:Uncharacterized protein n=1 Tax=Planctomicrobium piriforme TaxID=1576369 RepID=A0A1I3EHE9_9PLAN|nr:hypothetical protein [Planctomicrobium piriforme]SFH98293.1 hypothetical protein SAMN05421753_104220 [Planctomicrobium piriforme]
MSQATKNDRKSLTTDEWRRKFVSHFRRSATDQHWDALAEVALVASEDGAFNEDLDRAIEEAGIDSPTDLRRQMDGLVEAALKAADELDWHGDDVAAADLRKALAAAGRGGKDNPNG